MAKDVAIIGGTGFVGSYVVDALHAAGHTTSLLVRAGSEDKVRRADGQRVTVGDIDDENAIRAVLQGCDAVIYLVGILREDRAKGITFRKMQYEGVVRVADAAKSGGVLRFLLMSANGVEAEATPYQQTKLDAELYVEDIGMQFTVIRPSVIFGDPRGRMEFATQLRNDMVNMPMPAVGFYSGLKPPGNPVLMSPVHAGDVASAFVAALDDDSSIGETYELCGPDVLSWNEMIRRVAAAVGKEKWILPMPIGLMRIAATALDWLPVFPVTRDQLTMLQQNNVCSQNRIGLLLDRKPTAFAAKNLAYLQGR
ncbi:MAG: NAD(P)H-binding protein [Woeseiaceae bacterium]|nr:NAD(P)H-binding protein [Woeseiaceae bacterium]